MNNIDDLKDFAKATLVKSKDDISSHKEIIEKIKDKVIIIEEDNQVEITYVDKRPMIRIPLYLIGKFIGFKILDIFESPIVTVNELSKNLELSSNALSRPLGILTGDIIEKTNTGYKIRAFMIIEFLNSLEDNIEKGQKNRGKKNKYSKKRSQKTSVQEKLILKLSSDGIDLLAKNIDVKKEEVLKVMFFNETDVRIIDPKFIKSDDTKIKQLDFSLAYLLALKYGFGVEKYPSTLLRSKLKILGLRLTNLTTYLHKYPEYIIHDSGKRGSTKNHFTITLPGEKRIQDILKDYINNVEE